MGGYSFCRGRKVLCGSSSPSNLMVLTRVGGYCSQFWGVKVKEKNVVGMT